MQKYQEIVEIDESGLKLYTGLSSRQFAIAKMSQYVTEPGIIFVAKEDGSFEMQELHFNTTKSVIFKDSEIVAVGLSTFKGQTLYSYLIGNEKNENKLAIIEKLHTIVEWSFSEGIVLQNCGPLGTLINEDNNIVFLPFDFYQRSMFAQPQNEASEFYGCWTNGALDEIDSWRFTLSAYVYIIISGKKPFKETVSEKRAIDYYDNNYIPLKYCVTTENDFNAHVISIVDNNLSLTKQAYQVIKPMKKASTSRRIKAKVLETQRTNSLSSKALPFSEKFDFSQISEQKADVKVEKILQKRANIVSRKRFIRKNAVKISVVLAGVLAVGIIVGSVINTQLNKPTTEGMDPYEVVVTLYDSLNSLDTTTVISCGTNKAVKDYSTMVSTILVSSKMKESYEDTISVMPPDHWLNFDDPLVVPVFGVTNVDITTDDVWSKFPEENDTVNFTVTYNMIYSATKGHYEINLASDELTLTYGKKFWQITHSEREQNLIDLDIDLFSKELQEARDLIRSNSSIPMEKQGVELLKLLQDAYRWLPAEEDVAEAVNYMDVQYFLPLPSVGQ